MPKGLTFKKCDFHIHTPASKCFEGKATEQQIVQKAIDFDLSAIAVTDHNTGEWVDKVKEAAKGTDLTIFPGVEITVGEAGIHLICLLDTNKGTIEIEDLLISLKIQREKFGKEDAYAPVTIEDAINTITKHAGLAIFAHSASTNGALSKVVKQAPRIELVQNPELLAAEIPNGENKTYKVLTGGDPNYKRILACYQASDNPALDENGQIVTSGDGSGKHTIEGIGYRHSYFCLDDKITLESLRQCFVDPKTRILLQEQYNTDTSDNPPYDHPYIKSINVRGGFLDGLNLEFHAGLNSILGAKGVGKSLLIEFLRFGLDRASTEKQILTDHESKLKNRLEDYSQVTVTITDSAGSDHEFTRTYNPADKNPYNNNTLDVTQFFPVLFFSQNEIIKIAEDESLQIEFIDKFFDFRSYQNRIEALEIELSALDTHFTRCLRAFHELQSIEKEVKTKEEKNKELEVKLKSNIFEKYSSLQKKKTLFDSQILYLENYRAQIVENNKMLAEIPLFSLGDLENDPELKRSGAAIKKIPLEINQLYESQLKAVDDALIFVKDQLKKWVPNFTAEKSNYVEEIRKMGGGSKILSQARESTLADLNKLKEKQNSLKIIVGQLKDLYEKRNLVLNNLQQVYEEYSNERKQKCKFFENNSNNKIKAEVKESSNKDQFRERLLKIKKGSYLKDEEITSLVNGVTPREFVYAVLRYDMAKEGNKSGQLKEISEKTEIQLERLAQLTDFLLNTYDHSDLLSLQYQVVPKDKPEIKYSIGINQYELLSNLSTGQKCTAMLIMALCDGKMPIIIDQPEDSLDIKSIWHDVCDKLRNGKQKRQFIFTTHNSSLAVASDTDKYVIMHTKTGKGEVVLDGCIDSEKVKEEIINYLEGGIDPYRLKYLKYNAQKKLLD